MDETLLHRLERNFIEGRPLLSGARLYRGTRLPDQTHGHYSKSAVHGSVLLHVAAQYTHNWEDDGVTFIGTYEIDRAQTRFFQDYGLEKALECKGIETNDANEGVKSLSVTDAEALLEPFVKKWVNALSSTERYQAEEALNAFLRKEMYESNIPTRTPSNTFNRPERLYLYKGKSDVNHDAVAAKCLKVIDQESEPFVKMVHLENIRNPVIQDLHRMASKPASMCHPELRSTMLVLKAVAHRDFMREMAEHHLDKPLDVMMDAIALHPISDRQVGIGRFARSIFKDTRDKARFIATQIAQLDPATARMSDIKTIIEQARQPMKTPPRA